MDSKQEKIILLRNEIDKIDLSLIKNLVKRKKIVEEIRKIKNQIGIKMRDKKREEEIIKRLQDDLHSKPLRKEFVRDIYMRILKESLK